MPPSGPGTSLRSQDEAMFWEDASGLPWMQPFLPPLPFDPEAPRASEPPQAVVRPPGARSTDKIIATLEGEKPERIARTLAPFPVAGIAYYEDGWSPEAEVPGIARGQGTAIHAQEGTPVIASSDGTVASYVPHPGWGLGLELTGSDGTRYRYGHLLRLASSIQDGIQVKRGEILGYVGNTGRGSAPYLYYQIEITDGTVLPPLPYLDRWLTEAETIAGVVREASEQVRILGGARGPQAAGPDLDPLADGSQVGETLFGVLFFGFAGAYLLRKRLPWLRRAAR